ncbi:hypothetical protein [Actinoplanes sp. NPDC026619]|uniref:hypothetical protein n=1 Tax=Actinoplanes sp. NPDC026619 TaxID=3155798 RepID=UPI00340F85AF
MNQTPLRVVPALILPRRGGLAAFAAPATAATTALVAGRPPRAPGHDAGRGRPRSDGDR